MDKLKKILKENVFLRYCFMLAALYAALKAVQPPIPSSVMFMYMTALVAILAVHLTLSDIQMSDFMRPILDFFAGYEGKGPSNMVRLGVLVLIPLLMGYKTYDDLIPKAVAPAAFRTIHPAPPLEFSGLENPLRADEEALEANIKEGGRIYYENCYYCHGDKQAGKGHFADVYNPPPADFVDPTTIAMLQESFVFWRIATGGPGLPNMSTPWDSSMPIWQDMLTDKEIWQVILFIYDITGNKPRTWE